jgi:hypothetical protein
MTGTNVEKLLRLFQLRDGLASGEAGGDLVEELNFLFAQFPAEADVVTFVAADKIDEAGLIVLQFTADVMQLTEQAVEAIDGQLELFLKD